MDFAERLSGLRAARVAQGWSQSDAARALARTAADRGMRVAVPASLKTQLSRWENGHAVPEAPYRVLLAELYGRTAVELGLGRTAHTDPEPDPAGRLRARVAAAAAVDGAVVALWQRQLTTLQELDDRLGAPGAAAAVRVLVDQLEAVLPHLPERDHRRAVAALLSRAAALAGIQDLDAGDPDSADARFVAAADAAAAAGVPALSVAPALGRAAALVEVGEAVAALPVLQHDGLEHVDPHHRAKLSAATGAVRAAAGHTDSDLRLAVDIALPPAGLAVEHVADLHERQVTPVPPDPVRIARWLGAQARAVARESTDPTSSSAAR